MTVSVVALVTDEIRDGRPVVGFGFNSNGRYAPSGLLRDRFIPRLRKAPPGALVNDDGSNFDPAHIWRVLMTNEKPGGHGERSVAVGVVDMAVWDAVSKIEGVPLYRLLADRYGKREPSRSVWVYAAGGYYYPGKDVAALREEIQGYLDRGYTSVKIKIGGVPLAEGSEPNRGGAEAGRPSGTGLRWTPTDSIAGGRSSMAGRWLHTDCCGARPGDPLDSAHGAVQGL
jgi:L-alanine-DL-glutamate epimerase-like enolase superfamily enzyme